MLGHVAIGLAAFVGAVPASTAQDSRVLDHCEPAESAVEAEDRQADQNAGSSAGVYVALPIGRICVGPDAVDGEPSYVRRTTAKEGMAIVEVSTQPFMPVLASNDAVSQMIARPDQPAGW